LEALTLFNLLIPFFQTLPYHLATAPILEGVVLLEKEEGKEKKEEGYVSAVIHRFLRLFIAFHLLFLFPCFYFGRSAEKKELSEEGEGGDGQERKEKKKKKRKEGKRSFPASRPQINPFLSHPPINGSETEQGRTKDKRRKEEEEGDARGICEHYYSSKHKSSLYSKW